MAKGGAGPSVSLESYGATILRITLGVIFLMHAYLGLFTRWAALANLPIMAGAFFLVHLKHGFFVGRGEGYEYVMLVLAATLAQVFLGPGALALRR